MRFPARKMILLVFTLTGVTLLGFGLWMHDFVTTEVAPDKPAVVEVKPGSSFARTASQLEDAGVISDATPFTLLARWRHVTGQIHAGEYLFEFAASPGAVLDRLVAGDIRKFHVTIPEGFTLRDIAARLETTGIGIKDEFMALSSDAVFLDDLGIDAPGLEGYLFPETYTYTASTTPRQLLLAMVAQLESELTPELLADASQLNLDRHQLITLASIIQKEAGNAEEMPLISAVFNNRLRAGIPLQADPTVIYGIADFNGNLTRKDLATTTPYNTYRIKGLPPGPIASPGLSALHAAAHPADSKALFFVSRGDGTHEFSATLKDHNLAVRRYQLRRRSPAKANIDIP